MSRDYGVVRKTFWESDTIRPLAPEHKFLGLYLLTSPHTNAIGCFRLPIAYVQHDTGMTPVGLERAFAGLRSAGFVVWCERHPWIWIPNYLKHNPPENPNVWRKCVKEMQALPVEISARAHIAEELFQIAAEERMARVDDAEKKRLEPYRNHSETVPKGCHPNLTLSEPCPEPEPIPEPNRTSSASASPPLVTWPAKSGEEYPVSQTQADEFAKLYPNVNILEELRAMRGWCLNNPSKRKTIGKMGKFMNSWLTKAQKDAGQNANRNVVKDSLGAARQALDEIERAKARRARKAEPSADDDEEPGFGFAPSIGNGSANHHASDNAGRVLPFAADDASRSDPEIPSFLLRSARVS